MSSNEVSALISLIEDPDENIYAHVRHELISHGENVLAALEFHWQNSNHGPLFLERIEELIGTIHYDSLYRRLKNWKNQENPDLLEGALLLNRYQYPGFDESELKKEFMKVRRDIWLELNDNLTALEKVKVLNKIIFEIHEFTGNTKSINSPQNSYINNVIETKKGNPITLGIIYLSVCEKLGIPVYGVNVPAHFILGFSEKPNDVLFYLNVFNKGSVFFKPDIDKFLEQLKTEPKKEYYIPCDTITIIKRLIQHLIYTYDNLGYLDKKEELTELLNILEQ